VSAASLQIIVEARTTTKAMAKVEGIGKAPTGKWETVIPDAIKYGALRRMSQGADRIEGRMNEQDAYEAAQAGQYVPTTLTAGFLRETKVNGSVYSDAGIQALAEVLATIHTDISDTKFADEISGY
jgi:hypothetical protein